MKTDTIPYRRYTIEAEFTPDISYKPPRFHVDVKKLRLIKMVLKELLHFRGNTKVALDRPCVYGVFSGPLGGLAPRENLCVGCLRCTVENPDVVRIYPHPNQKLLGDSYILPKQVETILYEARTGRVPVSGAGYRGSFSGKGWDNIYLDFSVIVRPTRDGIHGREYISTKVDIGEKSLFLTFDNNGKVIAGKPKTVPIQVPFLFDATSTIIQNNQLLEILNRVSYDIKTMVIIPISSILRHRLYASHVIPLVDQHSVELLNDLPRSPRIVEINNWDSTIADKVKHGAPEAIMCARVPFTADIVEMVKIGIKVFHLTADYHGNVGNQFIADCITNTHERLVRAKVRENVTLIGSGGISMAEHVPKAIISGLDAVSLDTALWIALQAHIEGELVDDNSAFVTFPKKMNISWAIQRLKNLAASWHDQLLEVLGAIGMRDVRRLRGEIGRRLILSDLEAEAFKEVAGYE
ncbi:glutamate synthase-related protein [Patescibacteria group bacterium AH-259-L05]|nr:glutamate synthase-related protein [Patescibacteria group bacterium AH-259-L05]